MTQNELRKIIKEELTKSDVSSMISDRLNSYLRKSELEKDVKKIVADVMEKFYRLMYNKRGFWKNEVSNG